MRCDSVLPLLSDYADRSLSPFAALRVRCHLQKCAACQTAWADVQTLNREARALYSEKTALPPGLRNRVLTAAPAPAIRPARRRRSWAEVAVLTVCVLAGLFSVAMLNHLSRVPARPAIAFAQVEAAMQNVQTVHWIETQRSSSNFGEGAPLGPREFPNNGRAWSRSRW